MNEQISVLQCGSIASHAVGNIREVMLAEHTRDNDIMIDTTYV